LALINGFSGYGEGGTEKFYSYPVILITVPKLVDRELAVVK
jgi:hypothetical protein